jgi:ABC-type bacteriocin/lantibiotic exporter with double-glycine peptidase domain
MKPSASEVSSRGGIHFDAVTFRYSGAEAHAVSRIYLHRLSTLAGCERAVALEGGCVAKTKSYYWPLIGVPLRSGHV